MRDDQTRMTVIRGLVIVLVACSTASCNESPRPLPASQGLDGFWQTEGYGQIFDVRSGHARVYEVTAVSCILANEFEVRPSDADDVEALFVMPDEDREIDVQPGSNEDERWLRFESTASRRHLNRINELPATCSTTTSPDPVSVFDTFWQTYSEHYPFFTMKAVDWEAVGKQHRARLGARTSNEELFQILRDMTALLEDAHIYVEASDLDMEYVGVRPDPTPMDDEAVARAFAIIDKRYLLEPPSISCGGLLAVGRLPHNTRYFRLLSFSDFGRDYASGLACLEATLDQLLESPGEIDGVVLDVRINDGGFDPYGLAIASRFATAEYLAYTKETRNDPTDDTRWSEGQPSLVRPTAKTGFAGPVVLLIGQDSVSAAETFTMALMGRVPAITRIGENTQGVFSDVMERSLPNGWQFGLPNEQFLTVDGRTFDGPGIPPDVETPVFTPADLEAGKDSALVKALEILGLPQD